MTKRRPKQRIEVPRFDAVAIGKRIRRARRSYGWDERDLADKLGTDHSVISLYERGWRVPRLDRLIALATALRRSMEFLLFGMARRGRLHRLIVDHGPGTGRGEKRPYPTRAAPPGRTSERLPPL